MKIQQLIESKMDELYDRNGVNPKRRKEVESIVRKLIEAVGEEIIGEDEEVVEQEVEVGSNGCTVYDVTEDISIRKNQLRAEQRLKLKEILSSIS